MGAGNNDSRISLVFSSGVLRVTIPPKRSWVLILLEIVVFSVVLVWAYSLWAKTSFLFHGLLIWGLVSAFLTMIYQFSVTQVTEFDSQQIAICKEVRGWERKKEYRVEDCSELEWSEGSEHQPAALKCKVGWRTIKVCEDLSESESIEILTALQGYLPDVAQKLSSAEEHFLTLGLDKQK